MRSGSYQFTIFFFITWFLVCPALIPGSTSTGVFGAAALANPFTRSPAVEKKEQEPPPLTIHPAAGRKLAQWQQQLKADMSRLIRESGHGWNYGNICLLLATAFLYGIVHAAGPGHGKALALSYIIGTRPGYLKALLFSNTLALTHAASGILLVIAVKFILQTSMTGSLDQVTQTTQWFSFSLVTLLGLWLFIRGLMRLKRPVAAGSPEPPPDPAKPVEQIASAAVIGLIPCPGVVMVVLFCLSMNVLWLGILMGFAIGGGMALTISMVSVIAVSGKSVILSGAARFKATAARLELFIEIAAGLMVTGLGLFLLFSTVSSAT